MHIRETKAILRECGLFRDLNDIHLDLILMVCEEISYLAGEFIFHQEDPGDALYIVARGKVTIFLEPRDPLGTPIPMAVSVENNSFGEVILVDEGRRTASARCRTDTQLIRISRERLLRLCHDYPEIGFHIMRRMAEELALKLRSSNRGIRDQLFSKMMEEEGA